MQIEPKDPRRKKTSTIIIGKESLDLPMPRFLIDEYYVGEVPNVEVTFENLNDNIDKQFLQKTIVKYAEIEEVTIMYHPTTNKHLGKYVVIFKLCQFNYLELKKYIFYYLMKRIVCFS